MKKMTKILSLALALVLVLGMTSLAEGESVLLYDLNFDDALEAGEYNFNTFKANSTVTTQYIVGNTIGRYYLQNNNANATMQIIDGRPYVTEVLGNGGNIGVGYRFPEAWNRPAAKDKALVILTDVIPMAGRTGVQYQAMMPIVNYKLKDDTNVSENYPGYKIDAENKLVFSEAQDRHALGFKATGWAGASGYNGETIAPWTAGKREYVGFVAKSANLYNNPSDYLTTFTIAGEATAYPTGITQLNKKISETDAYGEQILGFNFITDNTNDIYIGESLVFELSTLPADFKAEQEVYTNVSTKDKKLDLILTMPMIERYYGKRGSITENVTDHLSSFVVNDGTKDLVYGTDYTVDADIKVDGTAVKGVVSFILNDMDYNQTFTVSAAAGKLRSYANGINSSAISATFTTEAAPTFNITLSANKGLNASGSAVTASNLSGTVYLSANATNTTGRDVNGVIVIGIYDADNNLVKYAACNAAFANSAARAFGASFKVEAGQTAKAFVKGTESIKTLD